MTDALSRSAVVVTGAATAAVPAVTLPALAYPAADPIFAAIERHKAAFLISQESWRRECHTPDCGPDFDPVVHKEAYEVAEDDREDCAAAVLALTTIKPTTLAGIIALAAYVEAFNNKEFGHHYGGADDWRSCANNWRFYVMTPLDDETNPFGYAILSNIRRALERLAVQS
jgi:hypothetical protein